jgi:hypothetical protein
VGNHLLKTELKCYDSHRVRRLLSQYEGRFALLIGNELLGVFDSHSEAYQAGLLERGNVPMLIRRIERHEPIAVWGERIVGLTYGGVP